MTTHQVHFYGTETSTHQPIPYICRQEPIEYFCDGKEGYIHFDGYYYVENHAPSAPYIDTLDTSTKYTTWLPQKLRMFTQMCEKEPYKVEVIDTMVNSYYKEIETQSYMVEIYKKIIHENTDVISEIADDDGNNMNVTFFPTNRQTIYFRVIETNTH